MVVPAGVGSLLNLPAYRKGADRPDAEMSKSVEGKGWWISLVLLLGFGVIIAYFLKNGAS